MCKAHHKALKKLFRVDWEALRNDIRETKRLAYILRRFRSRMHSMRIRFRVEYSQFSPPTSLWFLTQLICVYDVHGIDFSSEELWKNIKNSGYQKDLTIVKTLGTPREPNFSICGEFRNMLVYLANRRIIFISTSLEILDALFA